LKKACAVFFEHTVASNSSRFFHGHFH